MIADRIEGKWMDLFAGFFARCKVGAGDACAILSESQSRALNLQLAELGLARFGARVLYISNEHPDALERLDPYEATKPRVRVGDVCSYTDKPEHFRLVNA